MIELLKDMNNITLKITEKYFSIFTSYSTPKKYYCGYVTDEEPQYLVQVIPADIAFERSKAEREDEKEGIAYRVLSDDYLATIAVQRKITEILIDHDVLLFHGSVVAVDGQAYLFTAQSGTGKSTHTRLWREMLGDRAVMVNDDKPFLQMTETGVVAWGSPWNGKHRLGSNIGVPLKAICILERSETNRIEPIRISDALPMLFQQSQRPQNPVNLAKYMELVDKLANSVEFYRLGCNMDPEAARISYEAMSQGRKDANL